MKFFSRKSKQEPETFESLARKASEHEDCFILAAFPRVPGLPDESEIDEDRLGEVIYSAVQDYLASIADEDTEYRQPIFDYMNN
jgi:hypothetical protein